MTSSPARRRVVLRATLGALCALASLAAGCARRDPYDPAHMDLHPAPARLVPGRHTGPYSSGSALSPGPLLRPLDPAPVKTIRLDTVHRLIDVAPGVRFRAWTFGGQVPGPIVHARVGDRIRFSMTNRSDEAT